MDPHDALIHCCEKWQSYPCNLLRPNQLKSALASHSRYLDDNSKKLFNDSSEEIHFLELDDGDEDYQWHHVQNSNTLQRHLRRNQKDPRCRFIFFGAADSRSPFNCSRRSFSYTLSFFQVPASFLDFVSSFGSTTEPVDYHMTGFHCDDTLGVDPRDLLDIPRLGRSGCEHRMQYLLRSAERSSSFDRPTAWHIRQMAVYHAYDFGTGRALWMNVKANGLMRDRINEAVAEYPALGSRAVVDPAKSFAATLATHLIHLEWCDEEWRHCINDIEGRIRDVVVKAKTARIVQQPNTLAATRALTAIGQSKPTAISEKSHPGPLAAVMQPIWRLLKRGGSSEDATDGNASLDSDNPLSQLIQRTAGNYEQDLSKRLETFKVLDSFSVDEVQLLHCLGEQLEQFRLVMELNRQTLRDIAEHYQDLQSRSKFPPEIKKSCERELASFARRVERIRKNLEVRTTQVQSLTSWLQDGKTLFDGILQYRSVQASSLFTESSQFQAEKMETIAHKTERETISMHVITCVTLAFLPGTFVAAFFQSGLIEVNASAKDITGAVTFHPGAFKLFATICFPLMAFTFIIWVLLFRYLSRRASRRAGDQSA